MMRRLLPGGKEMGYTWDWDGPDAVMLIRPGGDVALRIMRTPAATAELEDMAALLAHYLPRRSDRS